MTDCYIGLGSNMEPRKDNLEKSIAHLSKLSSVTPTIAPIYQTPALLPTDAPSEWNKPYLNTVVHLKTSLSAKALLIKLKEIEQNLGRDQNLSWGPRPIDLDILFFGHCGINNSHLKIPHPGIYKRDFVLRPLLDVLNSDHIPKKDAEKIKLKKKSIHLPAWMHILNLSPDSFSDGKPFDIKQCLKELELIQKNSIQYLDIGAASTRPGADPVSYQTEIERIEPFLNLWSEFSHDLMTYPRLSIDTMHASVAQHVQSQTKLDCINDVSGIRDPEMVHLLQDNNCEYVLMHSLSAPVDPKNVIPETDDPILFLRRWLDGKLDILDTHGIDLNRIIFDPGLGFGKTANQSLIILQNLDAFKDIPCRMLIGHSRKSFMGIFSSETAQNRDHESIALSLALSQQHPIAVFRVHNAYLHQRAWLAQQHVITKQYFKEA